MRPDSSGLATFSCFYVLFKAGKTINWKANFEGIVLLSKGNAKGRERLNEVQFVIDSCRSLANQIIWTIVTRIVIGLFQRALSEISRQLTPLLLLWKIKFGSKIQGMRGEIIEFFIIKQIKKPRRCSVQL